MKQTGAPYTVNQLARLANISVRTLHHYDQIGLLVPARRSASRYRLYDREDLQRLQQILFYRELDVPLESIRSLLDDPAFDPLAALKEHQKKLELRMERLLILLETVHKSITTLSENTMDLSDAELYEGFSQEQIERYKREVKENYDPELVRQSEARIRKMSREQWKALKQEGEDITRKFADLADLPPGSPAVQEVVARHHAMIEKFYDANAEVYMGLGTLYITHPEFRAHYDRFRDNLAEFIHDAIQYYAKNLL